MRADNQTCRPRACRRCLQSNGLGTKPAKGVVRHEASKGCESAGRQQRVKELGLGGQVGWVVGQKERGAMRGRESKQPNVSPASLPKVSSE